MDQSQPTPQRRLIVTADDYGAAECIDQAILTTLNTGIVTAVGVLTNYPRAQEAVTLLHTRHPEIGIGVHLNITSGPPLTRPIRHSPICDNHSTFPGLPTLIARLRDLDTDAVETELRAQISTLTDRGITPDHLSSHHNILALFPPLQDILTSLAAEFSLPVRAPVAVSQTHTRRYGYALTRKRAIQSILGLVIRHPYSAVQLLPGTLIRILTSRRRLKKLGVITPDHLIDTLYGKGTIRNIRHILQYLPTGTSELVMHLGDCTESIQLPDGVETDRLTDRRMERNLILNGTLRQVLRREEITLVRFTDLPNHNPNKTTPA